MKNKRVLIWFRQDLRLHDNTALLEAIKASDELYPVYVFDERKFLGDTFHGFRKTGALRAQFIIESVGNLRENLQKLGGDLIVRTGKPEEIVFDLAKELKTNWVFCNRERTQEEVFVQDALEKNLWTIGQELRFSRGKMLYFTADLPFPVTHVPNNFCQFRKEIERIVPVRKPLNSPKQIQMSSLHLPDPGNIPELVDFGYDIPLKTSLICKGGETFALKKMVEFFNSLSGKEYDNCGPGFLTENSHISFFSPYLAQGCLSPKIIYSELLTLGKQYPDHPILDSIYLKLLRRDFLRFMAKRHGQKIFQPGGTKGEMRTDLKPDLERFRYWHEGNTGIPIVDAGMNQLNRTGYITNLGRRICADYLVNHMHADWRLGAEYFESRLIDYDPCSNWVNWNYIAGVAEGQGEFKIQHYLTLAKRCDPAGTYVKTWLPVLKKVPEKFIHEPHMMSPGQLRESGINLRNDYPFPVILEGHLQTKSDNGHSAVPGPDYASQSQNFD